MRHRPADDLENPIRLNADEEISHEEFVDLWIDHYAAGDARRAASILLEVNRTLTNKLEAVTGKKAHELFDN